MVSLSVIFPLAGDEENCNLPVLAIWKEIGEGAFAEIAICGSGQFKKLIVLQWILMIM